MRASTRETLRAAAFEAAFVVLGVVLALAANAWRESRAHRRQGATALREIPSELRAHRERQLLDVYREAGPGDTARVPAGGGERG